MDLLKVFSGVGSGLLLYIGFSNLQKLLKAFPDNDKLAAAVIQTTFEGHSINTVEIDKLIEYLKEQGA